MARIETRKRKRGTVYIATVRLKGHPTLTQTFERKADAQAWATDKEAEIRRGRVIESGTVGTISLDEAMSRYLATVTPTKKPNTQSRDHISAVPLRRHLGRFLLRDIRPSVVAEYRDLRLNLVSPSTLQKELALLSHLFTTVNREWELPIENPVTKIRKPALPEGRLRLLNQDEAQRLLEACRKSKNPKLYAYVLTLMHTGMRPSEAAGLKWKQVDFERRIVDLQVTKTVRRSVPLTDTAIQALQEISPEERNENERVFLPGNISDHIRQRPNLYFRRAFDNALKRSKITDFNMHDLRHTAASHLLMAGVDLRTLAEILGHRSMQMVQRYTHLLDDHKLKAIDRIKNLGVSS